MPRIAEITETKDGRPCVVLEMSGPEGAVSLYTPEEIEALLRRERQSFIREIADMKANIAKLERLGVPPFWSSFQELLDALSESVGQS